MAEQPSQSPPPIKLPLTRKQKIICAKYWHDGMTFAEIGRLLRMDRRNVFDVVKRAEERLRAAGLPVPVHHRPRPRRVPVAQLSACGGLSRG